MPAVKAVRADGIELADGSFVEAELVVWAAGVKAPDMLREIAGLETNRINQLVVTPSLQTTRDPAIFADRRLCGNARARGLPPRCRPAPQAAHQQASHLYRQIQRQMAGQPLEPYRYRDFGSLITLGKYSTIGSLMGFLVGRSFRVEGLFAKFMYRSLYKMHEYALHGGRKMLFAGLMRGLSKRSDPQVKLH